MIVRRLLPLALLCLGVAETSAQQIEWERKLDDRYEGVVGNRELIRPAG
jgi:hypothetical protein